MKKWYSMIAVFILLLFLVIPVQAVTWHLPTENTIGWDALPPVPTGQLIKYRVYLAPTTDEAAKQLLNEVETITFVITFPTAIGAYMAGVSAVLYEGIVEVRETSINWSNIDLPTGSTPNPFGYPLMLPPSSLVIQ